MNGPGANDGGNPARQLPAAVSPPALSGRLRRVLQDILDFANEVDTHVVALGESNFQAHRPTQYIAEALVHRIGEAVSRLPEDFTAAHPEVAWQKVKGMRNVVAHEYGFIDYRIVWRALSVDLRDDVVAIQRVLEQDQAAPRPLSG